MASSLPRRIAVAVVAIPATLGLVYLGGWPLALVMSVLGVLGAFEVFRLAEARGARPLAPLGYLGAALTPLLAYAAIVRPGRVPPLTLVFIGAAWIIVVMAVAVMRRAPDERPLDAVAVTVFAVSYTAFLPSFLLLLRHADAARSPVAATALVFLPLVVTWVCDSAAMGGGSLIGGAKFAPRVSPNKTWAGTISGSVSAVLVAPFYGWLVLGRVGIHLGALQLAVLGLVLSVVGQVGDLGESLLKREAGVKDSGRAFGAHGGVLDRLDSLYWVIPTTVMLLAAYGAL